MKRLTRDQVIEKLEKDDKDFRALDLSGLILCNMDLSYANLSNADLSGTDLYNTDLYNANLSCANLTNADLSNANLENANLSSAYLENADLSNADLGYANLSSAYLENANLYYANLENANLSNAELFKADLSNTRLDEKEQIRKGMILKEPIIGYKRCCHDIIVTLEIPKGAIVFSINNTQCRTNKAKVLKISNGEKIVYSDFDNSFTYELGKEIEIEDFDLRYNVKCSSGIHFFKTREEAEEY